MVEPLQQFQATLKQQGQSLTRSRQVIFTALQDREPQTMAEIITACQGQINRASVYRIITLFEKLGIVQRLQIGWKYKLELSDSFHHHHHHLTCNQCGTTFPIQENIKLEQLLDNLAATQNFMMEKHQLEIQGSCQTCRLKT